MNGKIHVSLIENNICQFCGASLSSSYEVRGTIYRFCSIKCIKEFYTPKDGHADDVKIEIEKK